MHYAEFYVTSWKVTKEILDRNSYTHWLFYLQIRNFWKIKTVEPAMEVIL